MQVDGCTPFQLSFVLKFQDEKLNQKIKATLNPDRIRIQENTIIEEDSVKDEENDSIQGSEVEEDSELNEDSNAQKKRSRSEKENERRQCIDIP